MTKDRLGSRLSGICRAHPGDIGFWGAGLCAFPLVLVYTAVSLSVFRGKAGDGMDLY